MAPLLIVALIIFSDIVYLASRSTAILTLLSRFIMRWILLVIFAEIIFIVFSVLTLYAHPAAVDGFYGLAAIKKSVNTCFKIPASTFL